MCLKYLRWFKKINGSCWMASINWRKWCVCVCSFLFIFLFYVCVCFGALAGRQIPFRSIANSLLSSVSYLFACGDSGYSVWIDS